jgi:hypothetical protein
MKVLLFLFIFLCFGCQTTEDTTPPIMSSPLPKTWNDCDPLDVPLRVWVDYEEVGVWI